MAKKTSRRVSKNDSATTAVATPDVASVQKTTTLAGRATSAASPDFSYVRKDLRRIGILAGSMFAAMIILYFILPYILPLYAR
jgi:hypothetical protein